MGALLAAEDLGIPTGGWAPRRWQTERGPYPDLGSRFGLVELRRAMGYRARTRANVVNADGTAVFAGDLKSPGTQLTIAYALERDTPLIVNPTPLQFCDWLVSYGVHTLNVAGNRESLVPGIQEGVRAFLVAALREDESTDEMKERLRYGYVDCQTSYAAYVACAADLGALLAEVERLRVEREEIIGTPEKWMRWCDHRVLERAEAAESQLSTLRSALAGIRAEMLRLLISVAEQQAIPDDSWRKKWDSIDATFAHLEQE